MAGREQEMQPVVDPGSIHPLGESLLEVIISLGYLLKGNKILVTLQQLDMISFLQLIKNKYILRKIIGNIITLKIYHIKY